MSSQPEEVDAYEQAFRTWLWGIRWADTCRREEHNLRTVVDTLHNRGYMVEMDYRYQTISVAGKVQVTMQVARKAAPLLLLAWIEDRIRYVRE